MKNHLIKFLFWLLDVGGKDHGEDDREIVRWLTQSANDIGFIRYCETRERALIRGLILDGLAPMPRDSFVRKSGQRFELHALLTRAQKMKQISNKKLAERRKVAETDQ